jgi:hypothetical protein
MPLLDSVEKTCIALIVSLVTQKKTVMLSFEQIGTRNIRTKKRGTRGKKLMPLVSRKGRGRRKREDAYVYKTEKKT